MRRYHHLSDSMPRDGKRVRVPWLKSRFALFALVLAGTCLGCSQHTTAKKQTQIIEDPNRNITKEIPVAFSQLLKRKVGIYTLENPSLQRGRNFHEVFAPMLREYLHDECSQIIVANPDTADGGLRMTELPRLPSGQIDAYALAILGRQLGFNVVFSTMLKNIYLKDEEQGILWTKDTHFLIRVRIVAEAYDVRTATKFLDQSFSEEIEVDETEYRLLKENKGFSAVQLSETYPELIEEIGSRFCDKLQDIPWSGYVTAVNGEKIIISSGSHAGLEPDDVLDVFAPGEIMEGIGGQRFIAPGPQSGKLRLVKVNEDRSEAVLVSGDGVKPGSSVMLH